MNEQDPVEQRLNQGSEADRQDYVQHNSPETKGAYNEQRAFSNIEASRGAQRLWSAPRPEDKS
jgi:hypothetical protein